MEAAQALKEIKKQIHIPLVADIHFDYRLAIAAMENGADKIVSNLEISEVLTVFRQLWMLQKSEIYQSV